jgi:hypothetical protein
MDEQQKNQLINNIEDLLKLKNHNSFSLFVKSLPLFYLSSTRLKFLISTFVILFFIIKHLLFPSNLAINIIYEITVIVNNVMLPIFAVIITGYAIFQALVNGKTTMLTLISVKHNNTNTKFEVYNLYFYGISIWYLFIIIFNFILSIIFKFLPREWSIYYLSKSVNEIISAMMISVYITIIVNFLIEMKSFIYNLFQVFITNASSTSIDYLQQNDKDKNK